MWREQCGGVIVTPGWNTKVWLIQCFSIRLNACTHKLDSCKRVNSLLQFYINIRYYQISEDLRLYKVGVLLKCSVIEAI